jgi:serine protease AprX
MNLRGTASNQTVKVIVQYKQAPKSSAMARVQNLGGRISNHLGLVNGAALAVPARSLAALANDPDVAFVSVDHPLQGMDDYTDSAMNASAAWSAGYDGTGIGVAVIDSGINDTHSDLWISGKSTSRVVYHQDFTGTATTQGNKQVWDLYGHGTHVAGIIGGNGNKSAGRLAGVAPKVNLIDLRVLDANGAGSDSMVIAAIQQAIALKSTYNIKVINLSLGRGIFVGYARDPLCQAVESAWKSGIVVVAAAGNFGRISVNGSNGYGTVAAPGNDPLVLTVGAMKSLGTYSRTDDQIASYSSKGPTTYDHVVKPDVVAPGNMVVSVDAHGSTLETEFPGNEVAGSHTSHDYFTLSGTSMATPAVAGGAALLLQQNPSLTPDQIKARLMKTASKTFPASTTAVDTTTGQTYTSYYDLFTVGAGYVDLAAALASNDLAPATVGSALSPSATYHSSTGTVTLSNGNGAIAPSSVVWGTSVVWGSSVVWGTNVSGSSVVWGTSVVWGSSVTSGFSVVWGASTDVAGSSVVWGSSLLDTNGAFSATDDEQ